MDDLRRGLSRLIPRRPSKRCLYGLAALWIGRSLLHSLEDGLTLALLWVIIRCIDVLLSDALLRRRRNMRLFNSYFSNRDGAADHLRYPIRR